MQIYCNTVVQYHLHVTNQIIPITWQLATAFLVLGLSSEMVRFCKGPLLRIHRADHYLRLDLTADTQGHRPPLRSSEPTSTNLLGSGYLKAINPSFQPNLTLRPHIGISDTDNLITSNNHAC